MSQCDTELEGEPALCGVGSEELGNRVNCHSGTELESGTWQISSLSPRPYHPRFSVLPHWRLSFQSRNC